MYTTINNNNLKLLNAIVPLSKIEDWNFEELYTYGLGFQQIMLTHHIHILTRNIQRYLTTNA